MCSFACGRSLNCSTSADETAARASRGEAVRTRGRRSASWKYVRGRASKVGQASRLPSRAERRGSRTSKASLRSAGQARRLPYLGVTRKLRPNRGRADFCGSTELGSRSKQGFIVSAFHSLVIWGASPKSRDFASRRLGRNPHFLRRAKAASRFRASHSVQAI